MVTIPLFSRCRVRLSAEKPSPQWPCSADDGHTSPIRGTWISKACFAFASFGWLDQRWWCASGLEDETACSSVRGGHSRPRIHHRGHLSLTHDVCRTYWSKQNVIFKSIKLLYAPKKLTHLITIPHLCHHHNYPTICIAFLLGPVALSCKDDSRF